MNQQTQIKKISKNCYTPLLKIRFLRIYNSLDNTVYLNLYFSNKVKSDHYFCILYDITNNKRYLQYYIREDDPVILWQE